jgi:enoyl-CoA hydratase/carnithine racemase
VPDPEADPSPDRSPDPAGDRLVVDRDGAVATLCLNRPESRNAISLEMYQAFPGILRDLDDDDQVAVIVLRGAGQAAFAAGADIGEFQRVRANATSARVYNEYVSGAELAVEQVTKPTIAMVHGFCIGGGCGLALACDLRFADTAARFAITPSKLGLVYNLDSTKRLVDLVGPSRAKWVLMSGQQLDAPTALRLGLVDEVVEPDELATLTYDFARLLTTRAQYSVRAAKHIVARIMAGQAVDDAETTALRDESFDTSDYAEGVRAFLEKRPPRFGPG